MVKVVENGERICTVTLDGSESSIVFQNDYKYFAVKNESNAAVYVSLTRDIVEGADGVMTIGSKESALFAHMKPNVNMFFVKGTGKIQVFASNAAVNPFKSAPVASGGGGENVGYISDGLIAYSDLNDELVYNAAFDDELGRSVNNCNGTNGYGVFIKSDVVSQLSSEFTLQILCRTANSGTYGEAFGVVYDSAYQAVTVGINDSNCFYVGFAGGGGVHSTSIINDDKWHMLTASYSDSVLKMYIDGVNVMEYSGTWNIHSGAQICVGQWITGVSRLIGHVANACIYNRCLSDSEIMQNWNVDVSRYGIGGV